MKKQKCMRGKLNNCGLTLIEVLIAMTLLTIAIVPMLRAFVQVNRYGEKGRNLQQTTTIAQTAMENCKAYNITDIHNQMAEASFLSGDYLNGATWSFNEANGTYYISDMIVDNRRVGMSVKLDPVSSTTEAITKYEDCNDRLDGIFVESLTMSSDDNTKRFQEMANADYDALFEKVVQKVNEKLVDEGYYALNGRQVTLDEVKASYFSSTGLNSEKIKIVRNINIVAGQTGGVDEATVQYVYTISEIAQNYKCEVTPGNVLDVDVSGLAGQSENSNAIIYKNANTKDHGGKMERIYFYYYPVYSNPLYTEYPCKKDEILVKVEGLGRDVDVYLIKQKYPGKEDITIDLGESTAYAKAVKVVTDSHVDLYHNYGVNIGKTPNPADPEGHKLAWPGTGELIKDDDKCTDKLGLVEQESKALMYNVKVEMFANPNMDSGVMTGELILSLDGTKINW